MANRDRARALALDPGGTSGVAILLADDTILTLSVPCPEGDQAGVLNVLLDYNPRLVIVERFLTRGLTSIYGIETMELIGAIKCLHTLVPLRCYRTGGHLPAMLHTFDLIRRTPSQRAMQIPNAKRFLTERRTRDPSARFTDHEVDALAHLLSWMKAQERMIYNASRARASD